MMKFDRVLFSALNFYSMNRHLSLVSSTEMLLLAN